MFLVFALLKDLLIFPLKFFSRLIFWFIIWIYHLFMILSTLTRLLKSLYTLMLSPLCLTVATVFFGLKDLPPPLCQTKAASDQRINDQKFKFFSRWHLTKVREPFMYLAWSISLLLSYSMEVSFIQDLPECLSRYFDTSVIQTSQDIFVDDP